MDIIIGGIKNQGDHTQEYVSLKVNADCDAGQFLLADTTYSEKGKVSSKLRHVFWLPDKQVRAGDFIWVHTGLGKNSENSNKAGTTTHHFYWGLKVSVWNDNGDCAVLFHCDEWAHAGVVQA